MLLAETQPHFWSSVHPDLFPGGEFWYAKTVLLHVQHQGESEGGATAWSGGQTTYGESQIHEYPFIRHLGTTLKGFSSWLCEYPLRPASRHRDKEQKAFQAFHSVASWRRL